MEKNFFLELFENDEKLVYGKYALIFNAHRVTAANLKTNVFLLYLFHFYNLSEEEKGQVLKKRIGFASAHKKFRIRYHESEIGKNGRKLNANEQKGIAAKDFSFSDPASSEFIKKNEKIDTDRKAL